MGHQMELQFDHDLNDRSIIDHYDDKTYDDLCIIQCDIEEAAESGDQNRLLELIQMRTAYQQ